MRNKGNFEGKNKKSKRKNSRETEFVPKGKKGNKMDINRNWRKYCIKCFSIPVADTSAFRIWFQLSTF